MSRAVDRITAILSALATQSQPSTLSDIAEATGLDKSTLYRFLQACERNQLVRRDPDGPRYTLGFRIVEWGGRAIDTIDVARLAVPVLDRLSDETHETVALHVREGRMRTAIVVRNSPLPTLVAGRLGRTAPLAVGAAGKAILGFLDDREAHMILNEQPDIDDGLREHIRSELDAIRTSGYAKSEREITSHAWSIAAPVFDSTGAPVASIGILAPVHRHSTAIESDFVARVLSAAEELTRSYGGVLRRPHDAMVADSND